MSIVSVQSDAAGPHLSSGECAPSTAFTSLDPQSLLSDLPPPESTLFQVVAQEEVVASTEPTVSAVAGPLSEGDAIQAVFDRLTEKRPEDGLVGLLSYSAAPTTTVASSLTRGSLPQPSPFFRIPLDPSLVGVRPLLPPPPFSSVPPRGLTGMPPSTWSASGPSLWPLPPPIMSTLAPSTAVAGLQRPLVRPSASATATAPLSTGSVNFPLGDSSSSIGDTVEQMDASVYSLEDTSSQAVDDAASLHSASSADLDLKRTTLSSVSSF